MMVSEIGGGDFSDASTGGGRSAGDVGWGGREIAVAPAERGGFRPSASRDEEVERARY